MATSKSLTLQVSDIVNWFRKKEIIINETFQRHSVWNSPAKTFLIDTILNELPIPKIYIRTRIDPKTQQSVREIVDGQQRVRAMVEFASDELRLSKRSELYSGLKYSDLDEDRQTAFLGYTLTAEQLLNASDDDIVDIFSRLNSYTVPLNPAEKRHSEFQTEFKFAVRKAAQHWVDFWELRKIFSIKARFRMADDTLMAEMFGVLLEGVTDGGAAKLKKLYERQDDESFDEVAHARIRKKVDWVLGYLNNDICEVFGGEFSKHYHVLTIFAAIAHNKFGIPAGDIKNMPARGALPSAAKIVNRLSALEQALATDKPPAKYAEFVKASESSTHRISSRRPRFLTMHQIFTD